MSVYYEKLKDRDLWIDGQSSIPADVICDKIFSGVCIEEIFQNNLISGRDSKEVKKFLKLVPLPLFNGLTVKFKEKSSVTGFKTFFDIEEGYRKMNIEKVLTGKLKKELEEKKFGDDECLIRVERVEQELELFKDHGLLDVLPTCCYIVDTLHSNKVVWGPGRGSSCCSYILYLIGIHNIDSVAFDLEMNEFLR